MRSDYVSNFSNGHFGGAVLQNVTSKELIARMDALRLCIQNLPENSAEVSHTKLWLVHADKLDAPPAAAAPLTGACYRYEFVIASGAARESPTQNNRLLQRFQGRYVCYVSPRGVSWAKTDADRFSFQPNMETV